MYVPLCTDGVDQLCWHPSHQDQLATASGDKSVRFWCVPLHGLLPLAFRISCAQS